jgi:hypothetical protein
MRAAGAVRHRTETPREDPVSELLEHDRWSRERLLDHQRAGLRALLSQAVASSPYYREALGPGAGAGEIRLEDLPTLAKATLMGEFDRIVTDPRLRRAGLERHVKGPAAAEPLLGEYRVFSTSGTTGRHGLIVYSGDELAAGVAVSLRTLRRIGVTPAMRLVAIGAPSALHWTRQLFAAFRSGRARSPDLAVTTPLPEMVEALDAYRPDVIVTYPTVAGMLAEEQLEGRLRIEPSIVALGSEVLTDDVMRRIHDAWSILPFSISRRPPQGCVAWHRSARARRPSTRARGLGSRAPANRGRAGGGDRSRSGRRSEAQAREERRGMSCDRRPRGSPWREGSDAARRMGITTASSCASPKRACSPRGHHGLRVRPALLSGAVMSGAAAPRARSRGARS